MPTAPTDVQISEVTATSVRLEWSYKGPEDLQYYVIQYKPKNANQVNKIKSKQTNKQKYIKCMKFLSCFFKTNRLWKYFVVFTGI